MSRFILIDHSLKGIGGHHFEYATHVLRAAQQHGFEALLATHRRFRADSTLLPGCRIYPVFRHTTYGDGTLYHSGRGRENRGLLRRAGQWFAALTRGWNRLARVRGFKRGLSRIFRDMELEPGDHVFVPTLSELDLLGLARYLASDDRTRCAQWHLQFHFNIFDGREPDFTDQEDRLLAMRAIFGQAWSKLGGHRVRCYNTTAQLTAQYDSLGFTKFETLPYPVNPAFHQPRESRIEGEPLRVTVAGAIRAEKGSAELADVLRQGWHDLFEPGRVQLVVQSNKSWFRLPLPKDAILPETRVVGGESLRRPTGRTVGERIRLPQSEREPVIYVPHPLEPEAYVELLRRADIGLLLYDSERYYSRCSGVLVELLSLGVPVIVAAGCWMADQIAPAIHQHVRRAIADLPTLLVHALQSGQAVIDAPGAAVELVISAQWDRPPYAGVYARFHVECLNATGETIHASSMVVGRVENEVESPAMTHIPRGTRRIRIAGKDAYRDAPLPVKSIQARLLGSHSMSAGTYPLGAVGLIAADVSAVGDLSREMVNHWAHYRDTAAAFAPAWRQSHNADRIVSLLTAAKSEAAGDISRAA